MLSELQLQKKIRTMESNLNAFTRWVQNVIGWAWIVQPPYHFSHNNNVIEWDKECDHLQGAERPGEHCRGQADAKGKG